VLISSRSGAFFGTTFPTLFFQTYLEFLAVPFKWNLRPTAAQASDPYAEINPPPEFDPSKHDMPFNPNPYGGTRPPMGKIYDAKIYGFKVSERARSGPRMGWLRDRPDKYEELDQLDWKGRVKADLRSSGSSKSSDDAPMVAETSGARPIVGKGKLFEEEEELKENDEEDVSEEETAAAAPAS
jgi:casein kinase II subunit beta